MFLTAASPSVSPIGSVIGSIPFLIESLINRASFLIRRNRFSTAEVVQSPPNLAAMSDSHQLKSIQSKKQNRNETVLCANAKNVLRMVPLLPWALEEASINSTLNGSKPASTAFVRSLAFLLMIFMRSHTDLYLAPSP